MGIGSSLGGKPASESCNTTAAAFVRLESYITRTSPRRTSTSTVWTPSSCQRARSTRTGHQTLQCNPSTDTTSSRESFGVLSPGPSINVRASRRDTTMAAAVRRPQSVGALRFLRRSRRALRSSMSIAAGHTLNAATCDRAHDRVARLEDTLDPLPCPDPMTRSALLLPADPTDGGQ